MTKRRFPNHAIGSPPGHSPFESRRRAAAIFEVALDAALLVDQGGRFVDANLSASELLGYSRREFRRLTIWDLTPRRTLDRERQLWGALSSFGRITSERMLICKDGALRQVEARTLANLLPRVHLLICRDVGQQKLAAARRRQSELLLAETEQFAHVGRWSWDLRTRAVNWSDEQYRIFGLRAQEFPMTYDLAVHRVHPDDRIRIARRREQAFRDRQPYECLFRALRDDGTVRMVHSRAQVAFDESGAPVRVFGLSQDVTEQQQAKQQLQACSMRLQTMSRRLLISEEAERRHIARELHDEVGQLLTAVKLDLQMLEHSSPAAEVSDRLAEDAEMIAAALQHIRNLSCDLRPAILDDLGLASALRWYLDRQAQRAGFKTQLAVELGEAPLSNEIASACFRLAQEALTNVVRHARASNVRLELRQQPDMVEMLVRDDGSGFDADAARRAAASGHSLGLLGMQERAALIGGTLKIESAPSCGTEIRIRIPVSQAGGVVSPEIEL